jgi:hypothetical protein
MLQGPSVAPGNSHPRTYQLAAGFKAGFERRLQEPRNTPTMVPVPRCHAHPHMMRMQSLV